ncbi:hypothetical protein [Tenacibaculum holothuriorum]|nr:hypothetical protein [Tenacibaculum holothuriorum]
MNKLELFFEKKEKRIVALFLFGVFIGGAITIYLLAAGKIS